MISEKGRIPSAIGWVGLYAVSALLSKRMKVKKKGGRAEKCQIFVWKPCKYLLISKLRDAAKSPYPA